MESKQQVNDVEEIDLLELFAAILDNIGIVILSTLAGFVIVYLATTLFIKPTYESTTKIYVLNRQDDSSNSITYTELQTSTQLTKDYMELVTTRPVIENVISELGLEDVTYEDLVKDISVSTATDGRIISITVSAKSPLLAKQIADSVRNTVSTQIVDIMDVEAVNVVEDANLPDKKAKPATMKNSVLGGLVGLFLSCGIVCILAITNDYIKNSDDVEKYLGLSTLGNIPLEEKDKSKGKKMKKNNSLLKRLRGRMGK